MNTKSLLALIGTLAIAASASAGTTLAAQNLKCGGYVRAELSDKNGVMNLVINKTKTSKCDTLAIEPLDLQQRLDRDKTVIEIAEAEAGNALPIVVDDEVVILNLAPAADSSEARELRNLTEIEKEKLRIEKERIAREKARQDAKDTLAAAKAGYEVGTAVGNVLGAAASSSER